MDINKIEELIKVLENSNAQEISVRKGEYAVKASKSSQKKAVKKTAVSKIASKENSKSVMEEKSNEIYISSSRVGIYHCPNGLPEVGSVIELGQIVGSIQSMKILNDLSANESGVVAEVFVEDGLPVEYGQHLFRLEPVKAGG